MIEIQNGLFNPPLHEAVLFPFDDVSLPFSAGLRLHLVAGRKQGIVLRPGQAGEPDDQAVRYYGTVLGGVKPTVTDANALLGRVSLERFVTGYDKAAGQQAGAALQGLGASLNLSATEAALAILEISNANMSDAIKLLTLERGLDPRHFALIAFGGVGPLHAAAVARGMGIPRVLIPPYPGMCSALGMLLADLRVDKVMTYPATSERVAAGDLNARFQLLVAAATADLRREGFAGEPRIGVLMSMRYLGQNYEEDIPVLLQDLRDNRLKTVFDIQGGSTPTTTSRASAGGADPTVTVTTLNAPSWATAGTHPWRSLRPVIPGAPSAIACVPTPAAQESTGGVWARIASWRSSRRRLPSAC